MLTWLPVITLHFNISNLFVFTDGELHSSSSLSGGKELIVEAELTGGEGEVSWQHAQLFRQSLKDMEKVIFEILVEMEESWWEISMYTSLASTHVKYNPAIKGFLLKPSIKSHLHVFLINANHHFKTDFS